jgi:hypothetical protein
MAGDYDARTELSKLAETAAADLERSVARADAAAVADQLAWTSDPDLGRSFLTLADIERGLQPLDRARFRQAVRVLADTDPDLDTPVDDTNPTHKETTHR